MIVTLSGAQGTGKSTLLSLIETEHIFKNYVFIKEVVRSLMKQGIKINKGADHYSQCKILEQHYKNALSFEDMITDRCAVDAFVYATWDYLNGSFSFKEHKEHESIFLSCLPFYKKHYFLPIEFTMKDDGVRDLDEKYQQEIEALFFKIYEKYKISYKILKGTPQERFEKFLKF